LLQENNTESGVIQGFADTVPAIKKNNKNNDMTITYCVLRLFKNDTWVRINGEFLPPDASCLPLQTQAGTSSLPAT